MPTRTDHHFPPDDRQRLIDRYLVCATVEKKEHLAGEHDLTVKQLYNLMSRWGATQRFFER